MEEGFALPQKNTAPNLSNVQFPEIKNPECQRTSMSFTLFSLEILLQEGRHLLWGVCPIQQKVATSPGNERTCVLV